MVRHDRRCLGLRGLRGSVGDTDRVPEQLPLHPNVTKCNLEFASPSDPKMDHGREHVRGAMACPSRSVRAWVTAAMFIGRLRWQWGGYGPALCRQELGLSSDSKILLIYDISTPVFPSTPFDPRRQTPSGETMTFSKTVCLLLTFTTKHQCPTSTCVVSHHIKILGAALTQKHCKNLEIYLIYGCEIFS